MSSSQFFNPILNPEFDTKAYVSQAMAADNGLETGAAVGPSHTEKQAIEAEPEVSPDEEAAAVPSPQDLRSNPEVAPPAESQPENPEVSSATAIADERLAGLAETSPVDAGRDIGQPEPSDAGTADRSSGEAPERSADRPEVAVEGPGSVEDRPVPDSPEPAADRTPVNAGNPEVVSAQPDAEVDQPLKLEGVGVEVDGSIQPVESLSYLQVESPLQEDKEYSQIAESAQYEPAELEDTLDTQMQIGEPEIWIAPEEMTRITIEQHKDDLHMDLNDALGPGVSRRGGY